MTIKSILMMFVTITVFEVQCDVVKLTLTKIPNKTVKGQYDWKLLISHGGASQTKPKVYENFEVAELFSLKKGESVEFNSGSWEDHLFQVIAKIRTNYGDYSDLKLPIGDTQGTPPTVSKEVTQEISVFSGKDTAYFTSGYYQQKGLEDENKREDFFLNFITDESKIDKNKLLLFSLRLNPEEVSCGLYLLVANQYEYMKVYELELDQADWQP